MKEESMIGKAPLKHLTEDLKKRAFQRFGCLPGVAEMPVFYALKPSEKAENV